MLKRMTFGLLIVTTTIVTAQAAPHDDGPTNDESNPLSLFNNRIMPIFKSTNPSSCVQCHLSSVDLKNYILPSHEKTFVSLRDQGLIDLDHPSDSKILKLIDMGKKDRDNGARLIHEDMRKAEYEAFASWITACCNDAELRNLPALKDNELAKPEKSDEVIRHTRKSRVINSFVRNIWSQRMRCFPCHTPHEIRPNQKPAMKKFEDWKDKYGERMLIFKKTPAETIQYLVQQSQQLSDGQLPLINLQAPAKSLLILKPTSKIPKKVDGEFQPPSNSEPTSHMGGLKMHVDDQSYKSFIAWIKDYANVVDGNYTSVEDLPDDNWIATKKVLRLKDAPETWAVGTPVQLFVHAKSNGHDSVESTWHEKPVAFTQGTITPRRFVNGSLFLLGPSNSGHAAHGHGDRPRLPQGNYLVKVYVDLNKQLATDPTVFLDDGDFVGQVEIENARWRIGFPKAEVITAKQLHD